MTQKEEDSHERTVLPYWKSLPIFALGKWVRAHPKAGPPARPSSPMRAVKIIISVLCLTLAHGHGTVVSPRSRNSIDYLVGVNSPKDWPSNADCANITGEACHNGQATFWYSQGCFIGCDACDVSARVGRALR